MRVSILQNNVIINIVEAHDLADAQSSYPDCTVAAALDTDKPVHPAPVVPEIITMAQARLALLAAGKLAAVDPAINALPEPAQSAARIKWDYSLFVHRDNGLISQLGAALGLTDPQIDALFVSAAAL